MKKNIFCIMAAVLTFSYSTLAANAPPLTAKQFIDSVKKEGAQKVIAGIPDADNGEWDYIMHNITNGNDDWLKTVPWVSGTNSEAWHEDIISALAGAIPANVEGVMSVITSGDIAPSINQVCSMPIYNKNIPQLNEYFVQAVQALYKSHNPKAKKCLEQLVKTVGQAGPFKEVD
jgi:hypothetical protein